MSIDPGRSGRPSRVPIGRGSTQVELLETGRAIYTGQCARCHHPKPIHDYAEDEWTGRILPKMAKKAKLSTGETEAVRSYILAARSVEPSPAIAR